MQVVILTGRLLLAAAVALTFASQATAAVKPKAKFRLCPRAAANR